MARPFISGNRVGTCLVVLACALAVGCAPKQSTVRSDLRRPGRVFVMRGLLDVYRFGMERLTRKLQKQNVDARLCQWLSHRDLTAYLIRTWEAGNREPICLIGHSQGSDKSIDVAQGLQKHGIPVALFISLDEWLSHEVPSNVRRVVAFHK